MDFSLHFGERLRGEREQLGFTQADACGLSGVSREMWGKYERGEADMNMKAFCLFVDESGADGLYILTGKRGFDHAFEAVVELPADELILLDEYRKLPLAEKRQLLTTLLHSGAKKHGT